MKVKLILLMGIVSVSFAASFIRLADAAPAAVAALRLIFASAVLLPLLFFSTKLREEIRSLTQRDLLMMLLSAFFLAMHFIAWITSLYFTSIASSVVLVTLSPVFITVYSVLIFRDRMDWRFWLGLTVALLGCLILGSGDLKGGGWNIRGDMLALAGAVAVAGYFLVGSRLRARISLLAYILPVYSFTAVFLVIFALLSGTDLLGAGGKTYLYCFLMAVICQLLGHSSFNWALKRLKASIATIAIIGEPVGASIIAFFLLGEVPTGSEALGGGIILAGIIIILRKSRTALRR
ncbi:MAG: EamA family transporter [Candidatus Latescibacteria bacterium]|nr:EamA family transporter [bacterium]MBD3423038.1 EamA family transporter [Candidatus Latescibacterota bacterium]